MKLLMDAWKKYANTDSMNEGKKCRENVSCNCVTANSGLSTAEVQKFLASIYGTGADGLRKSFDSSGNPDGKCVSETRGFIMKYQKTKEGLSCDGCVGPKTAAAIKVDFESSPTPGISDSAPEPEQKDAMTSPPVRTPLAGDINLNHIQIAEDEHKKFRFGKLKETQPTSWADIAKYWKHIGSKWLASEAIKGGYRDLSEKGWARRAPWSAAFIQYCMQHNKEFQDLRGKHVKGNHKYYHIPAHRKTRSIKKGVPVGVEGEGISATAWILLAAREAKKIGYQVQPGDICLNRRMHGDIVTSVDGDSVRKIGGNVNNSVSVAKSRTWYIITQSPEAKEKLINSIGVA